MLKSLRRIVEEVESISNFSDALLILVRRVREVLETEACSIFIVDFCSRDYVLMASEGLSDKDITGFRVKSHQSLLDIIGDQEKPLNLDDAPAHPDYLDFVKLSEHIFHAFLGVPIISDRCLLGVIALHRKERNRFSEDEEAFLVTLATQISTVIARAETSEIISQQSTSIKDDDTVLFGIPSGPGVGIGKAIVIYPAADLNAVPEKKTKDIVTEMTILQQAVSQTREVIKELGERLSPLLPKQEQGLFKAYLDLLDHNALEKDIIDVIKKGFSAQSALKQAIQKRIRQFESMDDTYLRERSADIKDLGQRILACLQTEETKELHYPEQTILIGEELSAADLARVPEGKLVGVAFTKGSANSHVAILARALGIPAVSGIHNFPYARLDGKNLIIDGYYGHVYITPTSALRQEFLLLAEEERQLDENLQTLRDLPAQTVDGRRIQLMVNTGLDVDAGAALSVGSDGVGLFRSELPFMVRERFPSEEEQRVIYRQTLSAFAPRMVTMRTLDIGGDKVLPYFPIEEENSFLGWRGIRISLDHPDLFQAQIRAMLRANREINNLQILLPMISHVDEFIEAKNLIQQAHIEVCLEQETPLPEIGAMIEVPSAVYQARSLAREADFLSVGSNDLTQYLLAVDRNNSKVARLYDVCHPAVLAALQQTVRAARLQGTSVSICGELAGDPIMTVLLIAMGFHGLSVNASNLLRVKWVVRRFTYQQMSEILNDVMKYEQAADIRTYLEDALEQMGLGGLTRAGK